jgi:hypothetical protein
LTTLKLASVAFKAVQPLRSVHVDKGEQDLDARVKTSHTDGNYAATSTLPKMA